MITPERWRQITGIFHDAIGRDPASRASFLDRACGRDAALRHEVNALLDAHERAGDFGERPVWLSHDDPTNVESAFATAEPTELPGGVAPGTALGDYRIDRVLGRGGRVSSASRTTTRCIARSRSSS